MKRSDTSAGHSCLWSIARGCFRSGPYLAILATVLVWGNLKLTAEPAVVDGRLEIRTVVDGLITPTTIAFLGPDDFLVLEKNTGRVLRIQNGTIHSTVLQLAVNIASERGMLGIALDPDFPEDGGV